MNTPKTFADARDRYLHRSTLKSPHTVESYRRAIDLFLEFLGDRTGTVLLPIQEYPCSMAAEIPLEALCADDAPIFLQFAEWLLTPAADTPRPYKPSTARLRLMGVQRWFQFLDDYNWLPRDFPLAKARRIVRDELHSRSRQQSPPQPPDHIVELLHYYERQERPARLQKPGVSEASIVRWELIRLRNNALLRCLAESGGRISEVLSLNVEDFPPRLLERGEVVRIRVAGKGGHAYTLRFLDALPAIRTYLKTRGADLRAFRGRVPLFVSHAPHGEGQRLTRISAWHVVQNAARALGLGSISPHDFRHWRATQLVNAGQPLDVVQDFLGHRSVETTRAYYARTDPRRVDAAAQQTRLPTENNEEG